MQFYKTKQINPIFIFDEGVIKTGECRLFIDNTYENEFLSFNFEN